MEDKNKIDYIGVTLILIFFILLSYAGFLSYKSIDWDVLKRLESAPLGVPTPAPIITSAPVATPSVVVH
ncbi:MAG: hypothetical protein Q7R95_10505 [bacterium]|nr:hypothetical protein [bacterium]